MKICLLTAACLLTSALPILAQDPWVLIELHGEARVIEGNGIPSHTMGRFPNARNPNRVAAQSYRFSVPARPTLAEKLTAIEQGPIGIAVNGVLFDPGTAEFWQRDRRSGWRYEALSGEIDLGLDDSNAHVQPNGAYHYHGLPIGLIEELDAAGQLVLLGWAADGFPIYGNLGHSDPEDAASELVELQPSFRLKQGNRPDGPGGAYDGTFVEDWEYVEGLGDLDACNGRFGVTPEFPEGSYHYVLTDTFPFIPRQLHGTPDASFRRRGPPPGGRPPPPPR